MSAKDEITTTAAVWLVVALIGWACAELCGRDDYAPGSPVCWAVRSAP